MGIGKGFSGGVWMKVWRELGWFIRRRFGIGFGLATVIPSYATVIHTTITPSNEMSRHCGGCTQNPHRIHIIYISHYVISMIKINKNTPNIT